MNDQVKSDDTVTPIDEGLLASSHNIEAENSALAGYKKTEVGLIPKDWIVDKIGSLCSYQNGTAQEKLFNGSHGYKVISIGNYSEEGRYVPTETYIHKAHRSSVEKFIMDAGDLAMILNDKTSIGTIIGRVLLIEKDDSYVMNQRTMRLKCKGAVSPAYMHKLINSSFIHKKIVGLAKPGTQIYINTNDVLDIALPYPKSKDEQDAITNSLSDVDALIDSLEALIAKKQAIKTATMQQLLTGRTRLPQFARRLDGSLKGTQHTELGEIPEDWDLVELGELLAYEQPTKYLVNHSQFLDEGSYPVLTAGKSFVLGYTEEHHGVYSDLPVIIFDDFTTASKFVDFPFKAKSSAMKMLKPINKEIPLSLIYRLLKSIDYQVGDHKRHWIGEFKHIKVALPSDNAEQVHISNILFDMDQETLSLEQRLTKTRQLKQGMMHELLSGRTRLVKPEVALA